MAHKNIAVVFNKNYIGARVYTNPSEGEIRILKLKGPVMVNPILRYVNGIPPQFWKLQKEELRIVSASKSEVEKSAVKIFEVDKKRVFENQERFGFLQKYFDYRRTQAYILSWLFILTCYIIHDNRIDFKHYGLEIWKILKHVYLKYLPIQ